MRILSLTEVAARLGCSRRTVERAISIGEGPTLTRISVGRIGVAEPDYEAWVASRRMPQPGPKAA